MIIMMMMMMIIIIIIIIIIIQKNGKLWIVWPKHFTHSLSDIQRRQDTLPRM
jgi:hypothetical protein